MNFFSDDYFFLKISRASNLQEFLNFFSPIREHSFKPFSTELYFFLIHVFHDNIFIGHLIAFAVFFLGLYYLYLILFRISGNRVLAYLTVFMYGIHFTNVFRLYYFGTYQEISLFTFLAMSFWYFINLDMAKSAFFYFLALLSKETAALNAIFIPFFTYVFEKRNLRKYKKIVVLTVAMGVVFTVVYQYSLHYVTQLENYRLNINPRLFVNNTMWYFLWSLGLPNYMPDYMTSIFKPPIREFAKVFINFPETKTYFWLLFGYWGIFAASLTAYLVSVKKQARNIIGLGVFCLISFVIFIGPIGFFLHKWMVRLAIPLVFVSVFQAFVLTLYFKKGGFFRIIACLLIVVYFSSNLLGVRIHESSSTFFLESGISDRLKAVIVKNRGSIINKKYIYFRDVKVKNFNPWGQSKHLKTTLGDQNFIDLYFPKSSIKAVYGFEEKTPPADSYIIRSLDILKE